MSGNLLAHASRQSLHILLWQLAWIGAFALLCGGFFGLRIGTSVLIGGGIGLPWTIYMAATMFKHSLTHGVKLSLLSIMGGWMLKVVLTVSLLVLAFRSRVFIPLAVLGGLFGSMVGFWYAVCFRVTYADSADGK